MAEKQRVNHAVYKEALEQISGQATELLPGHDKEYDLHDMREIARVALHRGKWLEGG